MKKLIAMVLCLMLMPLGHSLAEENSLDEAVAKVLSGHKTTGAALYVAKDGEIVYDNDVDTLMHLGDITFELTGSGTKVLSVYYNGELDHTQTVEFSQ